MDQMKTTRYLQELEKLVRRLQILKEAGELKGNKASTLAKAKDELDKVNLEATNAEVAWNAANKFDRTMGKVFYTSGIRVDAKSGHLYDWALIEADAQRATDPDWLAASNASFPSFAPRPILRRYRGS
jgi:hypothetical protein